MLRLKIILAPPSHHIQKKVKCNNQQYSVFLPLQNYCFINILQDVVFQPEYQLLISVLAKKRSEVDSFAEFYKIQEDSTKYFNQKVSFDLNDLSFKFLSQTDKVLTELDKCKFVDLMSVIHKAYDTYSGKLHSKFIRRIKKYLGESSRSQDEKQQIKKLIQIIKADSTEQEPQILQKQRNKKEQKKPSKKEDKKQIKKEQKKQIKREQKKEIKKEEKSQIKLQPQKQQKNEQEQKQSKQQKQQKQQEVDNQAEKIEQKKKSHNNQSHKYHKHKGAHKHDNNDEDEWEDIKQEKINKRKEKNYKRKHEKFDVQGIKKQTNAQDQDSIDEDAQEQKITKIKQVKNETNKQSLDKKLFEKTRQKPKKDLRVFLGLNGDSDDGWRERYRVERVPARILEAAEQQKTKWKAKEGEAEKPKNKFPYQKKEKTQKQPKESKQSKQAKKQTTQQQIKQNNASSQSLPKIIKIPSQGNLTKIFSYPADGKKFILKPDVEYKIRVNNNFWIIIEKDQLKIQKDKSGYIRSQKFQSNQDYIIQAQDLTISFENLCNLQDGGTPFGQPKIQNFTGSSNQWFHLKELYVYSFI